MTNEEAHGSVGRRTTDAEPVAVRLLCPHLGHGRARVRRPAAQGCLSLSRSTFPRVRALGRIIPRGRCRAIPEADHWTEVPSTRRRSRSYKTLIELRRGSRSFHSIATLACRLGMELVAVVSLEFQQPAGKDPWDISIR